MKEITNTNEDNKYLALNGYFDEAGKLKNFPGKKQKKKQALMLQFLAEKFATDQKYTETEVNEILNENHTFNDPATLRRLMFGQGILDRTIDGRSYWLVQVEELTSST